VNKATIAAARFRSAELFIHLMNNASDHAGSAPIVVLFRLRGPEELGAARRERNHAGPERNAPLRCAVPWARKRRPRTKPTTPAHQGGPRTRT